jgi:hypothetical protein
VRSRVILTYPELIFCLAACAPAVTVTVTSTVCATPGLSVPVPPASSYKVPPPAPITSVESTATAPLNGHPSEVLTSGVPPVESGVPSSGKPATPSGGVHSSVASAPGTTPAPSSTAEMTGPSPTTQVPQSISTDGAVIGAGMGSLLLAFANVAVAVVA